MHNDQARDIYREKKNIDQSALDSQLQRLLDHKTRDFLMEGQGVNHDVHDFPTAELGLKMGGFMLVHREGGRKRTSTWYDLP